MLTFSLDFFDCLDFLNELSPPAPLSSSWHSDLHFSRLDWLTLTRSKPLPPLLLSGCLWAPHQELPYWSLGMASSHNMAPHILPQPLERLFPDRKKVGCVCDSRLERSGTQEPSWTQHVLSLHTKSCWNSTFQVIYSFFPVEFRQRKCPEALDLCLFLLF